MIDHLDQETIDLMKERSDGPWVSIRMPTERGGRDSGARIRCKNLFSTARNRMEALGVNRLTIDAIDERANAILEDAPLWSALELGLVLFVSSSDQLVVRMAETCDEAVIVDDRPQIDVLEPSLESGDAYAVLALSLHHVRLFRGVGLALSEDDPPVLPTDIDSALGLDDGEKPLQSHAAGRVGAGRTTASFHGQGTNRDADVERFMRLVDNALRANIPETVPVVLAGVDRTVAAFRNVSRHGGLVEESIHGNSDRESAASLAERARAILSS